jgi:hypothetical protein
MKIKLKIEAFGRPAGSVVDVSHDIGESYIKSGDAERAEPQVIDAGPVQNKSMSARAKEKATA